MQEGGNPASDHQSKPGWYFSNDSALWDLHQNNQANITYLETLAPCSPSVVSFGHLIDPNIDILQYYTTHFLLYECLPPMIPFLSWNNFFKKLKITCVRLLDPGWWTGVRCLLPLSGKSPRPAFSWLSRPQVIAIVYCHVSASCLDLQPLAMASNGVKGTIVDAGVGQVDPHEVRKRCKNPDFREDEYSDKTLVGKMK